MSVSRPGLLSSEKSRGLSILVISVAHVIGLASWTPSARGKRPPLDSCPTSLMQEHRKRINLLVILLSNLHKQSNKPWSTQYLARVPCCMGFSSFPGRKVCEKQHRAAHMISPGKKEGARVFGAQHFLDFHAALCTHSIQGKAAMSLKVAPSPSFQSATLSSFHTTVISLTQQGRIWHQTSLGGHSFQNMPCFLQEASLHTHSVLKAFTHTVFWTNNIICGLQNRIQSLKEVKKKHLSKAHRSSMIYHPKQSLTEKRKEHQTLVYISAA